MTEDSNSSSHSNENNEAHSEPGSLTLSSEQKVTLDKFKALFQGDDANNNTTTLAVKDVLPLSEEEKQWCDTACFCRYLRARDWNVEKSSNLLAETLIWRRQKKPNLITIADVKEVRSLGTMYINGFDKQNQPVIYVKPGAYNPYPVEQRLKYLMYILEAAISKMDVSHHIEKLCWVIDFSGYGNRAKSPDGKAVAQNSLNILQNHYPERLGILCIINSPWYFSMLYTLLSPLLNSVTKKKIHWISGTSPEQLFEPLSNFIDPEQLEEKYGGKNTFKFNPDETPSVDS